MRKVAIFILAAAMGWAADYPMTWISEDEAEPIHSAIIRKEGWTQDAVRRLRAEAEKRLKEGPWTVTADRPKGIDLDVHDYYSESPYWWPNPENPDSRYVRIEGQVNPNRFLANKTALNAMSDAVFSLGTAAFLLDDPRYAQRAAKVIQTWFINPKTRMNPNLDYAQSIPNSPESSTPRILDGRVLIRAIQGMEFLALTGSWDPKDRAAVVRWFDEYLHWLIDSQNGLDEKHSGNVQASWWTAETAAVASFVENRKDESMAFNYYRDRVFPRQIGRDGSAAGEETRQRPLSYSAFNLEAFTMVCRIAQVRGVDLWPVKTKGGATIGTVIDFLQPYLADPHKWVREQSAEFPNEGLYFLAFAGMGLKKPEYIALYRKLERPEGAWLPVIDLITGRWEAAAHQTRH